MSLFQPKIKRGRTGYFIAHVSAAAPTVRVDMRRDLYTYQDTPGKLADPSMWRAAALAPPPLVEPSVTTFEDFASSFERTYRDAQERERRRGIFEENRALIARHNAEASLGRHSFWLGVGPFADLTADEFAATQPPARQPARVTPQPRGALLRAPPAPAEIDWTSPSTCKQPSGCVSPPKNQGACGSCWAFGAVGAMESFTALKTGELVNGSVQELLECQFLQGCAGGDPVDAFRFAATALRFAASFRLRRSSALRATRAASACCRIAISRSTRFW